MNPTDSARSGEERGSVAVELVIATPFLLLLLVFVAVTAHRGVDARLRLDDVAHQAVRAASLTRDPASAEQAARDEVDRAFADTRACQIPVVSVDTSQFRAGGLVTVTVSCTLDLTQAAPFLPARHDPMTATATSPIDTWRATTTDDGAT